MTLLVWRSGEHFDHFRDLPCVLCGKPTPLRSHADEPVHKVCAEQWTAEQPDSRRFCSDDTPSRQRGAREQRRPDPRPGDPWSGESLFDLA